jgi:hypothetical protein
MELRSWVVLLDRAESVKVGTRCSCRNGIFACKAQPASAGRASGFRENGTPVGWGETVGDTPILNPHLAFPPSIALQPDKMCCASFPIFEVAMDKAHI